MKIQGIISVDDGRPLAAAVQILEKRLERTDLSCELISAD